MTLSLQSTCPLIKLFEQRALLSQFLEQCCSKTLHVITLSGLIENGIPPCDSPLN